jgi:hypothetical protein
MMEDKQYLKYVGTGVSLTVVSAFFAVVGLITAIETSLFAGLAILVASTAFWGYTCLLSDIVEEKRTSSV